MISGSLNFVVSPWRSLLRWFLLTLGFCLMVSGWFVTRGPTPYQTLWIIDNSLSMMATDIVDTGGVMISRLSAAQQIVDRYAPQIGGQQGVISMAQGARLELPMTDDIDMVSQVAYGLTPVTMGGGSSATTLMDTVRLIYGFQQHLALIWLTDGEFSDFGISFSGFAEVPHMTIVGIGTLAGAPILEGYGTDGLPIYKESRGQKVITHRGDTLLNQLQQKLPADLITLDHLASLPPHPPVQYLDASGSSYGQWILSIGALCVVIGMMTPRFRIFRS